MKIDRLFAITNILIDKQTVTARELAEKFGVSVRTIYRDVDILSTNGVPVCTLQGKGGGISVMEGYSVDKTLLSDDEQNKILMALESFAATGRLDVDSSISKLKNVFKKESLNWIEIDFSAWEDSDAEKKIFENIKTSILNNQYVSFEYYSNSGAHTTRTVKPVRMVFKGSSWYLYAYCTLRNDYRFFKLRRIEELHIADYSANIISLKDDTIIYEETTLKNTYEMTEDYDKCVNVTLKIDKSMAFRVYDEFRNGNIENNGNNLIVNVDIPDTDWLYGYLLGYGDTLEILEPKSVKKHYKKCLKKMLDKYS